MNTVRVEAYPEEMPERVPWLLGARMFYRSSLFLIHFIVLIQFIGSDTPGGSAGLSVAVIGRDFRGQVHSCIPGGGGILLESFLADCNRETKRLLCIAGGTLVPLEGFTLCAALSIHLGSSF